MPAATTSAGARATRPKGPSTNAATARRAGSASTPAKRSTSSSARALRASRLDAFSRTEVPQAVAQDEVGRHGGHRDPSPTAILACVARNVAERVLRPQLLGDARVHAAQV